jgi:hypothetical protein
LRGGCVIREKVSGELYTEDAKNGELLIVNFCGRAERAMPGGRTKLMLLLSYIYEDIVAADFHRVAVHADGWVGRQFAAGHIVFPTVPRTYDDLALHFAFSEWTASMQAYIIDCK